VTRWSRGFRGGLALAALWLFGWGVGFGGLMEAFVDPHGELVDIWPAALGFAGLLGGVILAVLLRISERGRGYEEVAPARFAVWGLITGLILGALGVAIGLPNDIAIDTPVRKPIAPAALMGIMAALGLVAAIGSSIFFQLFARSPSRSVPAQER